MTIEEFIEQHVGFPTYEETWKAGQDAERDRLQPVIDSLQECHEAMEYMSEYDIPIGLPIRVSTALKIANGGKD